MKKILSTLLAICLIVVLIPACFTKTYAKTTSSNWMSEVPKDSLLSSLNIPGTHDSGMFNAMYIASFFSQTQELDIRHQLDAGVRLMDIRLRYGGSGELFLTHGDGGMHQCDAYDQKEFGFDENLTYNKLLGYITDFLEDNPSETVILTVQKEWHSDDVVDKADDPKKSNFEDARVDTNKKYKEYIINYDPGTEYQFLARGSETEKYDVKVYVDSKGNASLDAITKLESDIVVVDGWSKVNSYPFGMDQIYFEDATKDLGLDLEVERLMAKRVAHRCDLTMEQAKGHIVMFSFSLGFGDLMEKKYNDFDVCGQNKWDRALLGFLDSAQKQDIKKHDSHIRAAYASCTNQYKYDENGKKVKYGLTTWPDAEGAADYVNERLLNYNFLNAYHYGWIEMDYVTEELCKKIYETNYYKDEEKNYYISDLRGFCGDEKNNNSVDLVKTIKRCKDAGYIPLYLGDSANLNKKGYSMVLGYRLTDNKDDAITDVKGVYDGDNIPAGYTKVITKNSMYNYFTRGAGKSKDTYLYYVKVKGDSPLVMIELSSEPGDVTLNNGDSFNLQEGTGNTVGLNMIFDQNKATAKKEIPETHDYSYPAYASVFTKNIKLSHFIGFTIIAIAFVVIVIIKAKKNRNRKNG